MAAAKALILCFISNTDSTIPPTQSKQGVTQSWNNTHSSLCHSSRAGGVLGHLRDATLRLSASGVGRADEAIKTSRLVPLLQMKS